MFYESFSILNMERIKKYLLKLNDKLQKKKNLKKMPKNI